MDIWEKEDSEKLDYAGALPTKDLAGKVTKHASTQTSDMDKKDGLLKQLEDLDLGKLKESGSDLKTARFSIAFKPSGAIEQINLEDVEAGTKPLPEGSETAQRMGKKNKSKKKKYY